MGLGQWGKNNKKLLYDVYIGSNSKLWIPWTTLNCLKIMSVLKNGLIYENGLF